MTSIGGEGGKNITYTMKREKTGLHKKAEDERN
jgi:hypothetical protein